MEQRISAGGIVVNENKVLLVHHFQENKFDFWVLPGGGVEGAEGFMKAAEREVFEETNLVVKAEKIAYVQDFFDEGHYVCKFWVYCQLISGCVGLNNKEDSENFLENIGFFSQDEIQAMTVYPEILKNEFWRDLAQGFPHIKYVGLSQ